jgi:hypothetical protein
MMVIYMVLRLGDANVLPIYFLKAVVCLLLVLSPRQFIHPIVFCPKFFKRKTQMAFLQPTGPITEKRCSLLHFCSHVSLFMAELNHCMVVVVHLELQGAWKVTLQFTFE